MNVFYMDWMAVPKNGGSQYKSFILRRFLIKKSHFHLLVFLSISLKKLFGGHNRHCFSTNFNISRKFYGSFFTSLIDL